MFEERKKLRIPDRKISQSHAVLIIILFGMIAGEILIYQYLKICQVFK